MVLLRVQIRAEINYPTGGVVDLKTIRWTRALVHGWRLRAAASQPSCVGLRLRERCRATTHVGYILPCSH